MQFVVLATDRPGCLDLREKVRSGHRAYLRQEQAARVLLAGPTFDPAGKAMNGTMLILEAESIETVERFVAGDPYARAGLFARVDIRPWSCGMGRIDTALPDTMGFRGSISA